jgi:hypothetical protein
MFSLKRHFLFFVFIACLGQITRASGKQNITIEIKPVFAGKSLVLSTQTYVTKQGDTISIDRLRFYLSGFVLTLENGETYTEANSYHLIDAEDPSSFLITLKNVPEGKITAVNFNIGIDSTTSVSGALGGDLDPVKGMYWAWNSGYINAKLEGVCKSNRGKKNHLFEFHIGGYMQPHYAIRAVKVPLKEPASKIVLRPDISSWLEGLDLKKENSVMIPGPEAMKVADKYSKMFNGQN